MVVEIISYAVSPLNPLLKWIIFALFLIAAMLLYLCRRKYGGILHTISSLLLIGSIAGIASTLFRLGGDQFIQYKWGESAFNVVIAIIMLVIALTIRKKLKESIQVFEGDEGGEDND
jgi:hypothetical protein